LSSFKPGDNGKQRSAAKLAAHPASTQRVKARTQRAKGRRP
jgi:hypothetical protein